MDITAILKEWIQLYLKNKDLLQNSIQKFENTENGFIVHKTTGITRFLIKAELQNIQEIIEKQITGLVVLNTRKNLQFTISNWEQIAKIKELCIFFVNPSADQKWILYPYTHNQITEKAALKRGLESIFSMVPEYI